MHALHAWRIRPWRVDNLIVRDVNIYIINTISPTFIYKSFQKIPSIKIKSLVKTTCNYIKTVNGAFGTTDTYVSV